MHYSLFIHQFLSIIVNYMHQRQFLSINLGPNQTSGRQAELWLLIGRAFRDVTRPPSGSPGASLCGLAGSRPRVPGDRAWHPEFQGRRPTASISRLLPRRPVLWCYPWLLLSPDPDTSSLGLPLIWWPPQAGRMCPPNSRP